MQIGLRRNDKDYQVRVSKDYIEVISENSKLRATHETSPHDAFHTTWSNPRITSGDI